MDTGTWLSRTHANGHKNVSRRVNCYNEECAARECAANFSTVMRTDSGLKSKESLSSEPSMLLPKTPRQYCCIALFKMGPDRNVLAIFVVLLALCGSGYCSAQVGGCTPPAGSISTSGHGKLSNGIPQQNRGGPGSEFS